jgi:hypothetical protein
MNTSRSDERTSVTQTLGERMVMVARMLGAEHVRQVLVDDAGLDLVEIQRQLRARQTRQDLFVPLAVERAPFADAGPIALPDRVKARRKPPQKTIGADQEAA